MFGVARGPGTLSVLDDLEEFVLDIASEVLRTLEVVECILVALLYVLVVLPYTPEGFLHAPLEVLESLVVAASILALGFALLGCRAQDYKIERFDGWDRPFAMQAIYVLRGAHFPPLQYGVFLMRHRYFLDAGEISTAMAWEPSLLNYQKAMSCSLHPACKVMDTCFGNHGHGKYQFFLYYQ